MSDGAVENCEPQDLWDEAPAFVQIAASQDAEGGESLYGLTQTGHVWGYMPEMVMGSERIRAHWYKLTTKAQRG